MKEKMKNMKRMKNTGAAALAGFLAAVAVPASALAQQGGTWLDDLVYYEIGGGQALRGPAGYGRHARIRGAGSLALGYSCGQFDLSDNLRNMFGNLTRGLDQAVDSLTFAATGAVASLPLYLLRQANPNLANMMENMMLRYEDEYRLGVKSCRDAENQILAGENPYYDWVSFGQRDTWRKSAGTGAPVDEVREEVSEKHGCITWIGGDDYFCDDSDTRVIPVVEDVAKAGYELLDDADSAAGGAPAGAPPSRMKVHWPTADDAAGDILEMTGETVITNARTTPPQGQPPRGVNAGMHEDALDTATRLDAAVARAIAGDRPTPEELAELGVPGLTVTPSFLWTLGSMNPEMRGIAVERISTEIALLRAMERVNLARRILLAGSRVPEVEASPARELVRQDAIALLEMEARLLKDEYELRTRAASSTAAALMRHARATEAPPVRGGGGIPSAPATEGAVFR